MENKILSHNHTRYWRYRPSYARHVTHNLLSLTWSHFRQRFQNLLRKLLTYPEYCWWLWYYRTISNFFSFFLLRPPYLTWPSDTSRKWKNWSMVELLSWNWPSNTTIVMPCLLAQFKWFIRQSTFRHLPTFITNPHEDSRTAWHEKYGAATVRKLVETKTAIRFQTPPLFRGFLPSNCRNFSVDSLQ